MKLFCCQTSDSEIELNRLLKRASILKENACAVNDELLTPLISKPIETHLGKKISSKEDLNEHNMQFSEKAGEIQEEYKILYKDMGHLHNPNTLKARSLKGILVEINEILESIFSKLMPAQECPSFRM